MFALFVFCWLGQAVCGWLEHNEEQEEHAAAQLSFGDYLQSGDFWEATTENWESEFFQMAAFVLLSSKLFQRGSAESNDPDERGEDRASPHGRKVPWPVRRGGLALAVYSHSLSLALSALFLVSFTLHAVGGRIAHNHEAILHGQPTRALGEFMVSPTFWFQSFQNWQSEFLSVAALVVLSIFLRERGSSQSKPISAPHSQTGSG
jgi:hypothetical protein